MVELSQVVGAIDLWRAARSSCIATSSDRSYSQGFIRFNRIGWIFCLFGGVGIRRDSSRDRTAIGCVQLKIPDVLPERF